MDLGEELRFLVRQNNLCQYQPPTALLTKCHGLVQNLPFNIFTGDTFVLSGVDFLG
jgi:hypothetical protein